MVSSSRPRQALHSSPRGQIKGLGKIPHTPPTRYSPTHRTTPCRTEGRHMATSAQRNRSLADSTPCCPVPQHCGEYLAQQVQLAEQGETKRADSTAGPGRYGRRYHEVGRVLCTAHSSRNWGANPHSPGPLQPNTWDNAALIRKVATWPP